MPLEIVIAKFLVVKCLDRSRSQGRYGISEVFNGVEILSETMLASGSQFGVFYSTSNSPEEESSNNKYFPTGSGPEACPS